MTDYIKRSDALELARGYYSQGLKEEAVPVTAIRNIPSADVWKWIPVTERLPENDKTVLVWDRRNSREYFDVFDHGQWIVLRQEDITHWMPLPEPPKDDFKDIPIEYFESGGK